MKTTIQRDEQRLFGPGAMAVVGALLLVAIVGAAVYRLIAGEPRARAAPRRVEPTAAEFVSKEPPRVAEAAAPVTAAPRAEPPPAAVPTELETETAGLNQPFVDARREPRDSVWALQMESSVRDGLADLREKKVALKSVQCGSIRCNLEGTIGRGGELQDVVRALNKGGLKQGRFKRTRDSEGTTTFSAVFARQGYALDGSPREVAANGL